MAHTETTGLIAAAQAGDERAFRRLVDPYRAPLEVHCYRMLGSPQDAEDLVQETLLRAWRSLDRFERRASLKTWLYRIATNACIDELERRPRKLELVEPYPDSRLEGLEEPAADPAARYALHEGMELAFLTAIQKLPGRQRAVLLLRDVLAWSAREVADLLDTTVTGANSALQRARMAIDDEVEPHALTPRATHERELLDRYVDVWERADIEAFVALVREDAVLRMPPGRAVEGRDALLDFWFRAKPGEQCKTEYIRLEPTWANGHPAVTIHHSGKPFGVMLLDVADGRISGFNAFLNASLVELFEP